MKEYQRQRNSVLHISAAVEAFKQPQTVCNITAHTQCECLPVDSEWILPLFADDLVAVAAELFEPSPADQVVDVGLELSRRHFKRYGSP